LRSPVVVVVVVFVVVVVLLLVLSGCSSFLVALDAMVNALLGFCAVVDAVFSLDLLLLMVVEEVVVVVAVPLVGFRVLMLVKDDSFVFVFVSSILVEPVAEVLLTLLRSSSAALRRSVTLVDATVVLTDLARVMRAVTESGFSSATFLEVRVVRYAMLVKKKKKKGE
jgi:hypothetical protein